MKKHGILLLLLALVTVMALTFVGCNVKKSSSGKQSGSQSESASESETPSEEVEYHLNLSATSLALTLGDENTPLDATYDLQDGAELAFVSSDPSVVEVDEYGRLTALKVGSAVITATYGSLSATCDVVVGLNDLLPVLQLDNVPDPTLNIDKETLVDLSASVLFNNKTFTDVTVQYEVSDDTIGSVIDGMFTPVALGTTEITVTGTWRGIGVADAASMSTTITVSVAAVKNVSVNGGVSEITLYTVGDGDHAVENPFVVVAEYDGEALETTVTVTSGSEYVTYDAENQKVARVENAGYGEAVITVGYEIEGEAQSLEIPVHVLRTVQTYATTITNYSSLHGDAVEGTKIGDVLSGITEAYDAEGNAIRVNNDKVYVVPTNNDGAFETTITVYTNVMGYKVTVNGYGGIISSTEDLALFDINASYEAKHEGDDSTTGSKQWYPKTSSKPVATWTGYFILTNDIDASAYTHTTHAANLQQRGIATAPAPWCGFHGTFDGQGHTIKGMTVRAYGLFGYVVDATIKNVAFEDVTYTDEIYSTLLAMWVINSNVSNVYVSVANTAELTTGGAVFTGGFHGSSVSNVIVVADPRFGYRTSTDAYGAFAYRNDQLANAKGEAVVSTSFSDVYVITAERLGYYTAAKYYLLADNEEFTVPEGDSAYTLVGVKKYGTTAAFLAAGIDFTAFSEDYWDITSGAPVWKTLSGDPYEEVVIPFPDDELYENGGVSDFDPAWLG